jgi:hypothetical protein
MGFFARTSPFGKVSLTTGKKLCSISFLLPGDRMLSHRHDDPPANKLLPFACDKILQSIEGVNAL